MHERMRSLVLSAKERSLVHAMHHHHHKHGGKNAAAAGGAADLVMLRTAGQVVGDLGLSGRPVPAAATVRARSRRVRVLLVRRQDAHALRSQPVVKVGGSLMGAGQQHLSRLDHPSRRCKASKQAL